MPSRSVDAVRFPLRRRSLRLAGIVLAVSGLGTQGPSLAEAPAATVMQDVPGYAHRRWTLADGAPPEIRAIARTPDGYLWLGTADGLYRFDGLSFVQIEPVDFDRNRARQITALAVAGDGALWVGYAFGGTAVLRGGTLHGFNPAPHPRGIISGLVPDAKGGMWIAAWSGYGSELRHYTGGHWSVMEATKYLAGTSIQTIYGTRDGAIWLASYPYIYRIAPGGEKPQIVPGPTNLMNLGPTFRESANGTLWHYNSNGLFRIDPRHVEQGAKPLNVAFGPMLNGNTGARDMTIDADGLAWIAGDAAGLETVPLTDPVQAKARTVDIRLLSLYRDSEGTIWGGGPDGLHRFVRSPVTRMDALREIHTGFAVTPQGLYVGTGEGLYRIENGQPRLLLRSALVNDVCAVPGIGAYVFTAKGEYLVHGDRLEHILGPREVPDHLVGAGCTSDTAGHIWQTVPGDGIYRLDTNTTPRRWVRDPSLPSLSNFVSTGPGAFVTSTPFKRVASVESGHSTPIWPENDVAVGLVRLLAPIDGKTWIGGEAGLARYDGRRVQVLSAQTYPWAAGVMGIVRKGSDFWLISGAGILRIAAPALENALAHPGAQVPYARFGGDGTIRARGDAYIANDAAMDAQGRLWFVTSSGMVQVDPARIATRSGTMPVHVTGLDVDGQAYPLWTGTVQLPAGTTRVGLTYVGLGLVNAETNRYRYRLDGVDSDWVSAGTRRRVDFAGLGPGTYHFHVQAVTQDAAQNGAWPAQDTEIAFTIAPHFWQTNWFRLTLMVLACLGLYGLVRWRLAVAMRAQQDRIEARVAERERIARDLHDTLLQGFQGLMLRFQSILHLTPADSPARAAIEDALDRADDVLLEGRERVRGLREDASPKDLADVLRTCAARTVGDALAWHVQVDGPEQQVSAPVAEELALAVGEALGNAVRHAGASRVCVEVHHGRDRLAVRVLDDGNGLPDAVRLAGERPGHYGLSGMRERIERLGGSAQFANAAGGGTSIRFSLPGRIAYR